MRRVAAVTLVSIAVLAFADAVARQSLARPLNLYLDIQLASAVYALLTGALGLATAVVAVGGLVVGTGLLTWLLVRLLAPVEREGLRLTRVAGVVLLALSSVGLTGDTVPHLSERMALPGVRIATEQTTQFLRMLGERERFAGELAAAQADYASQPALLQRLRNRDVLLAFVESYGVTAVSNPKYATVIQPRLDELARRVAVASLHMASGTLVAPTQGGQSWFSHGSLFSGLWLDNQLRYDLFLASRRETLIDDFRRAGHRTVALMPAITMAWPEGEKLGYDQILGRRDIDYAGPPLNWVTMPDQFTWSFLEHSVRADSQPVFAELGLISSHAPWTPILPVLDDWDSIGDGSLFAPWEHAGERPEELWRDLGRIQEHYALSVDYAINAMTGYAERYVDDRTLLIVLGDHQPAPLITGENASRKVPVHVISGDPMLLRPFLEWGFRAGSQPDHDGPTRRMDDFRDWFVRAFSG